MLYTQNILYWNTINKIISQAYEEDFFSILIQFNHNVLSTYSGHNIMLQ